ncbi:YjcZ family sporulation protein [Paenibacillus sp. RC67]|nr:YjcZ family sporulation protein [Paenibacillus sp. RC67]
MGGFEFEERRHHFTSIGVILVLFILLVIISRSWL